MSPPAPQHPQVPPIRPSAFANRGQSRAGGPGVCHSTSVRPPDSEKALAGRGGLGGKREVVMCRDDRRNLHSFCVLSSIRSRVQRA
eukprot:scaffold8602_cov277-Pinguiococcus_pyrenoidosus.AAC.3